MAENLKVWGRLNSANVQKVVWALEEIGLSYEHEGRGGKFGGLDTPEYLEMNPNGLVPTLRDGHLILWESTAITRYLCAQYAPGTLYPSDPAVRATADQWTDWTIARFQPAWIGVFWSAYRTKPENQKPEVIAAALRETGKCLAILDRQLAASPYLGGEQLTYADIAAGVALYRWYEMEIERRDTPAVAAWYERLQQRPAYRKAVMVPFADMKGSL